MSDSFERQVFTQLQTLLKDNLSWATTVAFEEVELTISDYADHELPAVQFWFDEETFLVQNQRGHAQADIRITIEIVMKSTAMKPLTQGDLLDRLRDVRDILSNNVRLRITDGQMFQVVPIRAARDFVTQDPMMVGQLQISVTGQVQYGTC